MSITDFYSQEYMQTLDYGGSDFILSEYDNGVFIGKARDGSVVVAVKSANKLQGSTARRTELISVECNMKIDYIEKDFSYTDVFHIIKCYSTKQNDINLFLEIAMILVSEGNRTKDSIISTFQSLASFFEDKREPSENELRGLYAELYTIKMFNSDIKIGDYWQSRDRLKFDFSISDKVKVEVKSTIKDTRIHHFKHDQLATNIYNIFVLSYMLRHDDKGLSLLELINICKPYVEEDHKKLIRLNTILKNVDSNRLAGIAFEENLTVSNLRIVNAKDIPRFKESNPAGLTNAEYDCSLEGIPSIEKDDFIEIIKKEILSASD